MTAIANGSVTLTALTTEDDRQLTDPVDVPLTVNPSWENWTTLLLVIAMGLLVVVGVATRAPHRLQHPRPRDPGPRGPGRTAARAARWTPRCRSGPGSSGRGTAPRTRPTIPTPTTPQPPTTPPAPTTPPRRTPDEHHPPGPQGSSHTRHRRHGDLQPLRLLQASVLMASGSMVSRLLGFVRNFLFGAILGGSMSSAANAFSAANTLPNTIWLLVGGGTLNAIPGAPRSCAP